MVITWYSGLIINYVNINWEETCFGNYQTWYHGSTLYEWLTLSIQMHSSILSLTCPGVFICYVIYPNNCPDYSWYSMILKTHYSNLTVKRFNKNVNNKYLIYLITYYLNIAVWKRSTVIKGPNCNPTKFELICLVLDDRHLIDCWYRIMRKWKDYHLKR